VERKDQGAGNEDAGVRIASAPAGSTIGGTTAASRNVVSGNNLNGIEVLVSQQTKVLVHLQTSG
jgi:hypothetical protein